MFALDAEENNIKVDIPFLVDELPPRRNTQYGLKDARTSTKDHDAVDWQLSELADWAAQEGYRGVGRSYDFASPKVIWCSGLSAMLHVVRRGEVDAVAVTWISSLGRTRKKLIKILATLQKHNVALITTEENLRYQLYLYGLDTVLVKHTMRKADERSCPTA